MIKSVKVFPFSFWKIIIYIFGGAIGFKIGSFPVICGGQDESFSSVDQRYKLVAGKWKLFATMTSRRAYAAGIAIGNSIWIFGGYDYDGNVRLKSTEIINEDGQVRQGPN